MTIYQVPCSRASRLSRFPNSAPSHSLSATSTSQRNPVTATKHNMEHQRCYIYEPPQTQDRAPKRQRTSKFNPQAQLPERLATYRRLWTEQEERIQVRRQLSTIFSAYASDKNGRIHLKTPTARLKKRLPISSPQQVHLLMSSNSPYQRRSLLLGPVLHLTDPFLNVLAEESGMRTTPMSY